MTDPVVTDAKAAETKVQAAVATVATDAKAVASATSGVIATIKKYAPHTAVGIGGFVAGHYLGGVVFAVIKAIV